MSHPIMCALRSIFYVPGLATRRVQNTGALSSQSIHMAQSRIVNLIVNHSLHIAHKGRFFNQVVHMVHARLLNHCPLVNDGTERLTPYTPPHYNAQCYCEHDGPDQRADANACNHHS